MIQRIGLCRILLVISLATTAVLGFQVHPFTSLKTSSTQLFETSAQDAPAKEDPTKKEGYVPKWKKKQTLAEQMGGADQVGYSEVGLKGSLPIVFKQGNITKSTMALPGQPLRDVASQAGQFIKYGCGKGECGTCEALVDGKWIRPCTALVPASLPEGQSYVVQVKDVKAKSVSSGKFFSVRSFFRGFWNNLLGIVGFVKYRRNAKENWDERKDYEDLIKQKTMEKKRKRMQEAQSKDLEP